MGQKKASKTHRWMGLFSLLPKVFLGYPLFLTHVARLCAPLGGHKSDPAKLLSRQAFRRLPATPVAEEEVATPREVEAPKEPSAIKQVRYSQEKGCNIP